MFEKIANFFGFASSPLDGSLPMSRSPRHEVADSERSFDAAKDTEENAHQWKFADGRTINEILIDEYEIIVNRSLQEARRNPTVEGVIRSHACDVVGDEGPGLQMLTDDDTWNQQAESIWKEYAESVDGSGHLSLGDWLRQDVYQSWVTGDMIAQIVNDRSASTVIQVRVNPIGGQRLKSPYIARNEDIMLGVERNRFGRPIAYYFEDEIRSEYGYRSLDLTRVPARNIMHTFEMLEPGQVRGYPRLAGSLQAISDLREYDNAVLDAAKVQAMMAVLMTTNSDMVEPELNPQDVKLKRMGITRMPVGWQGQSLSATQPNNNNTEFRNERIRELGRPAAMPLMQIRLDSSGHNYSSARFDAQMYQRANRVIQTSLGRHRVKPLVMLVLNEAMMRGMLQPRLIESKHINFRWPQPPHVDPVKEAMAERIRIENRTLSPQMAAASHNLDFDKLAKDFQQANSILESHGLPPMIGPIPTDPAKLAAYLGEQGDEPESNDSEETTQDES